MSILKAWGVAFGVVMGTLAPALAQQACPADTLGVSRVVEIDTGTGPRFGGQHSEQDFLKDGEVVLTFDDGPLRAYTKPILDALAQQCTQATFFLVGRMALADPEMVKEYARRGHTVGTHTWSHANLGAISPLKARTEIELGFSAVQAAMGTAPIAPFFRFPYLRDTKATVIHGQERHVGMFSIDVDSKDYRTRDPAAVHRRVMAELGRARKGIVLFHDIQPSTARALPGLLAELKAKGFRVVHMQPRLAATTLPEFDELAQQEMSRRRMTVAAHPMAKRALTWSASVKPPTEPAAAKVSSPAATTTGQPRAPRPGSGSGDAEWPHGLWR
jgi:peptidoglycan-N-acetylglucosamine deacetylase